MSKGKTLNPKRSEAAKRGWETRRTRAHLEEMEREIDRRAQEQIDLQRATQAPQRFFQQREHRGGISSDGISQATLLRAFKGWAGIATNAIAQEVMSLKPYVAVRRVRDNGVVQHERLDEHPLADLLGNPSPNFSRLNLQWIVSLWLAQVGEAFLLKIQDGMNRTRRLEPLSPKSVDIIFGTTGIDGYVYKPPRGGKEITYSADEVIRIYEPDPDDPFLARGKLSPQALAYDASLFLDQTLRKHFKDDATPKVAIKATDGSELPSPEDKRRWEQEWINAYNRREGGSSGVPSMVPPGFDLHEFKFWSGKDLVPVLNHYRDQILSAYGVPGSVVGLVQDVNRAAAETNMFVFESTTIKPMADLIADALTRQLAQEFDRDLVVLFEDFITEDKSFKLEKREKLLTQKVVTINEVRVDEGLDPVEWGHLPVGQAQDVPYDGSAPAVPKPETPPVVPGDTEETEEPGGES